MLSAMTLLGGAMSGGFAASLASHRDPPNPRIPAGPSRARQHLKPPESQARQRGVTVLVRAAQGR